MRLLSLVTILLICGAAAALAEDPPPSSAPPKELAFDPSESDRPHLGATGFLGTRKVKLADGSECAGPILAGTKAGSGLEKAGGKQGDVIVGVGGWQIPADAVDPIGAFREHLNGMVPDTETELAVWREGEGVVTLKVLLGRQPPPFARLDTPKEWFASARVDPEIEGWISRAVALDSPNGEGRARYADVLARNRRHCEKRDPSRLHLVTEAHMNIAAQERLAMDVADGVIRAPLEALDLAAGPASSDPTTHPRGVPKASVGAVSIDAIVDGIAAELADADAAARLAFAAWTDADRAFVKANFGKLTERLASGEYLYDDEQPARERANRRIVALLEKVDRAKLGEAYEIVRSLTSAALDLLPEALSGKPGLVAARDTPAGRIELWGTGDNRHTTRCAFRFDLDGDDQYLDCGGRADLDHLVSVSIDFRGDDLWSGSCDFGVAAALCGVAIVTDIAGDDIYTVRDWGLGAAAAGVAVLTDGSGNDTYRAQHLSQGIGMWGAGLLDDRAGNDTYTGARFCQGVGFPGGVGALVDGRGSDRYACTGRYESDYGDAGNFSGWGQGCGYGFRGIASGGIGVLHDLSGDDLYEAGTFSQGGGYFYGWGILRDDAGNDRYVGARYAQGWAAHEAVGTFLEGGGDDLYQSVHDVAQGLSWDETSVFFRDRGGNDRYTTNAGFSLASAAHNGMVVFIDDQGDDSYAAAPAHAASNTYHGGNSFALFLDRGGKDRYRGQDAAARDDRAVCRDDGAYFVDLSADHDPDWSTVLR